jgi:stage II sporulation protein E
MEMLKLDNAWKTKLKDNRILLSEQLEGVGKVISSISKDIYINPTFNEEAEESIYKDLKNNRIDVKEVSVAGIGEEDFEVFVDLNSHNISEHKIKSIISESLGFPLVSDSNLGSSKTGEKRFKLLRNNRFSAMTKIATMPNSENKISGDSFTFGEIENTHFSALSDGMGIGRRANEESKVAISLLERLMEANVDKDLTLKTINSVLRAKSNEEMFTTLDLSFVDLYSGKLQMIKTGSPATFIKKKDRIEVINSSSLPVGILKDVDFNIYEEFVEDGDIIIMMSDGILDASRDIENTEEWMKKVIIDIDSVNPQIIAKEILEQAKNVITDVRDDMTVIVTKVWKNI